MKWLVGTLTLAGLLAALFLFNDAERLPGHVSSDAQAGPSETELPGLDSPEIAGEAPEGREGIEGLELPSDSPVTARSYLREYWGGERWPEIERAMLQAHMDLDQPFSPTPWEITALAIEPRIALNEAERVGATTGLFRWPSDLDPEAMLSWIRREFAVSSSLSLDEADLVAINDTVRAHNEEIAALASEWVDKIDLYTLERWRTGDFVKAPFGTIGVSQIQGFTSKSIATDGWSVVITLERERYPDMVQIEDKAAALREARDRGVTRYLQRRAGK